MKKVIITLLIISILVIPAGYFFIIQKDILGLQGSDLRIVEISAFDIELLKEQIFFDEGIISYSDKVIRMTDYNEKERWSLEIDDFINKVYIYDYIYVINKEKTKLVEIDFQGNKIREFIFDETILNLTKGEDLYIIGRDENGLNKAIRISKEEKKNLDIEGNIMLLSPKEEIDSYFLGYFYIKNGNLNSIIQQRLIKDDIKLWEAELNNEIIIELKQTSSMNFILTQDNFYTFTADGIILWKYNNFDSVEDLLIDKTNKRIYILETQKLHVLNFDSTVEKIVDLSTNYNTIRVYKQRIFLNNNEKLIEIDEEENILWSNEEKLIDYYIIDDNIYIESDYKMFKGKIEQRR